MFVISIFINIGMWFERFVIIVISLHRDFMPSNWAYYLPSPVDIAHASERAWALHQCLTRLESRHREVVSLAYIRDLSHSELATQLQLPLGTVKTWIRRGLDQLRNCMARYV